MFMFMWLALHVALSFALSKYVSATMSVPVEVGKSAVMTQDNPLHKLKISMLPSEHVDQHTLSCVGQQHVHQHVHQHGHQLRVSFANSNRILI